ncbi:MAG: iron uptake porin [Gloeotrichia echinulata HAB0833]
MTKAFWNLVKVSPLVVAATFVAANSALAGEVNEKTTTVAQQSQESNSMAQITSVSQFSDVQPTDWAFQALQSLVERYGCIAGYPNATFRGNRALTRYEFAAGLNACLDRVNELIATASADLVNKQDLTTLQRLQEEFAAELGTLRGQVDALEARTAQLEANQFSTTTKLSGEAIFSVSQAFGDKKAVASGPPSNNLDSNLTFSNRVRLSFNTSFTGTDQLQTRLQAGNIINNNSSNNPDLGNAATGTNMTRLGHDVSNNDNSVTVDKLNYAFNLSDSIRVKIDAIGAELNENVNVFNPDFRSSGSGALSRYGRFSPIYRQAGDGAGITVNFTPQGPLTFSAAYIAPASFRTAAGVTTNFGANNPGDSQGLFTGDSTIFGQVAFKPNQALSVGFSYARTYLVDPTRSGSGLFKSTGSTFANRPFASDRTEANNYGLQASFQATDKLTIGGWAGYTTAQSVDKTGANRGKDADIFYWAASVGLKDFGREGNVLGLVFGQPPKVTGGSIDKAGRDGSTSYHLEGLYKVKLSDNILVTPGVLVIFNPENNDRNDTVYVGTLRTTFTF